MFDSVASEWGLFVREMIPVELVEWRRRAPECGAAAMFHDRVPGVIV